LAQAIIDRLRRARPEERPWVNEFGSLDGFGRRAVEQVRQSGGALYDGLHFARKDLKDLEEEFEEELVY